MQRARFSIRPRLGALPARSVSRYSPRLPCLHSVQWNSHFRQCFWSQHPFLSENSYIEMRFSSAGQAKKWRGKLYDMIQGIVSGQSPLFPASLLWLLWMWSRQLSTITLQDLMMKNCCNREILFSDKKWNGGIQILRSCAACAVNWVSSINQSTVGTYVSLRVESGELANET